MKRVPAYRDVPFRTKRLVPLDDGCYVERPVTITPIIMADGCVVLEQKGEAEYLRPNLKENRVIMPYFKCCRVAALMSDLKWARLEDDENANSLDDIVAIINGNRDLDLMRRMRMDLGKSNRQLITRLDQLAGQRPPERVLDKIRESLQALTDCSEYYEDFIAECEEYERTVNAA